MCGKVEKVFEKKMEKFPTKETYLPVEEVRWYRFVLDKWCRRVFKPHDGVVAYLPISAAIEIVASGSFCPFYRSKR
jgi:hypothetical protein